MLITDFIMKISSFKKFVYNQAWLYDLECLCQYFRKLKTADFISGQSRGSFEKRTCQKLHILKVLDVLLSTCWKAIWRGQVISAQLQRIQGYPAPRPVFTYPRAP